MLPLFRRNPVLRELPTAVVQDWLAVARKRGYVHAVLALEVELSARNVLDDAAREHRYPLSYISNADRRCEIALKRLQNSAAAQAIDAFHESLWNLDPTNFAAAWVLARCFKHAGTRAEAFIHVAYCIATHFRGPEEAGKFIAAKTENKTPQEIIDALEDHFGKPIDQWVEVQNA